MPSYVIEHMEKDMDSAANPIHFPPWVALEYTQMLRLAYPSPVIFSSLSPSSVDNLVSLLTASSGEDKDDKSEFRAESLTVLELMARDGIRLDRVCLLDPKATEEISIEDGSKFDWFLFGGILGDDPPRDRTSELRKLGFPTRHLGPIQLTTDSSIGVTKLIVEDLIPYSDIPFIDHPTITFKESTTESVEMPFRYVMDKAGEPILPKGMRELLYKDMDQSFDFV